MNRIAVVSVVLILRLGSTAQAAPSSVIARFHGDYVLVGATGDLRFDRYDKNPPTLSVAGSNDELHIKQEGKSVPEEFSATNGRETNYRTHDGLTATVKMTVHDKELRMDKNIPLKKYPNLPQSSVHDVERWTLSDDASTLRICGHADAVNFVVPFRKSGCQIFKRK